MGPVVSPCSLRRCDYAKCAEACEGSGGYNGRSVTLTIERCSGGGSYTDYKGGDVHTTDKWTSAYTLSHKGFIVVDNNALLDECLKERWVGLSGV